MGKIVVVGSGFSGSILARKIAEELDRKVIIVEKRAHIGGNMYDEYDEHGILVQKYGPHFVFTNHYSVIEYLEQYAALFPYCAKLLSFIDGRYVRLPFNFETVQQLIGAKKAAGVLKKMREFFRGRNRVSISELVDCPDGDISDYGNFLFEKAYRTYTSKMWGLQPEDIDKSVLDRVPMAMNYDERYQNSDFQYLPAHGYTKLFENMLEHSNIELLLNTDAMEHLELSNQIRFNGESVDCLIYTGAIDELFQCKYGALPYRSLDIQYKYFCEDSVQPCEIISYPQAPGYTRSTEYRKIMYDDTGVRGTIVATEYPLAYDPAAAVGNTPYYPVLTEKSRAAYQRYKKEAAGYENLFLCGRLAEFKYYNMDMCILNALASFENVREYLIKAHK